MQCIRGPNLGHGGYNCPVRCSPCLPHPGGMTVVSCRVPLQPEKQQGQAVGRDKSLAGFPQCTCHGGSDVQTAQCSALGHGIYNCSVKQRLTLHIPSWSNDCRVVSHSSTAREAVRAGGRSGNRPGWLCSKRRKESTIRDTWKEGRKMREPLEQVRVVV